VGGRVKKRLSLAVAVAMRYGALTCAGGTDGRCDDCPTEAEPVHVNAVTCEACGGDGCGQCAGRGKAMLTSCPRACLTAEGRQVMQVAEFARKGCLPFAGGMLDQPATLMDAVEFVWSMEEPHRAKAGMD
jgi:hypothetical protein